MISFILYPSSFNLHPSSFTPSSLIPLILSKKDLQQYIAQDDRQFAGMDMGLLSCIMRKESYYIRAYKHHMRLAEYYHNVPYPLPWLGKLLYAWHLIRYERLGAYLHYSIKLNSCGPGLSLYHTGARIAVKYGTTLGANCTLLEGVVFGKKTGEGLEPQQIGDNCFFGTGTKILGSLTIGSNVTVGANSVVTHDLPDGVTAAGAPARILHP